MLMILYVVPSVLLAVFSDGKQCMTWSAVSIARSVASVAILIKPTIGRLLMLSCIMWVSRFIPSFTHTCRCAFTFVMLGLGFEPGRPITTCQAFMLADPSCTFLMALMVTATIVLCRKKVWNTAVIVICLSFIFPASFLLLGHFFHSWTWVTPTVSDVRIRIFYDRQQ